MAPESTNPPQNLKKKLQLGEFALTIELLPPRSPDQANVMNRLQKYFIGHADAINVTDGA